MLSKQIIFTWSPISQCPDIHYNILASNCGNCPTISNHTNVTCTDVPIDSSVCLLAVQTVICENITGNVSDTIRIALKGSMYIMSCDNNCIDRYVVTGAIISATMLSGILSVCLTICTTILIQRKRIRTHASRQEHESPDSLYAVVSHKRSSSSTIDIKKNVAYGQGQVAI